MLQQDTSLNFATIDVHCKLERNILKDSILNERNTTFLNFSILVFFSVYRITIHLS